MEGRSADGTSSSMAEMLRRLKLTAEESDALSVDDTALEDLATSDLAIIGKVLSSTVLNIQTIIAALRPAWGNPRGLEIKPARKNTFIAEFGSKQDFDRVLDGSPWYVGKKAVLVQKLDPNLRPSEVPFDKMSIWIRICDLPFGLMNNRWGWMLANKVGKVINVEVDAQGRAWGPYLRAKVQVDISKPLLRCISIFSEKRQTTELYDVKYEKLPNYCYSCGIIGHSSVECPTPAERDDNGMLPYGKNLRAPDDSKYKKDGEDRQSNPAGRNLRLGEQCNSSEGHRVQQGTDSRVHTGGQAIDGDEALSPLRRLGDEKQLNLSTVIGQGTKRKQGFLPKQSSSMESSHDAMALIVANSSMPLMPLREGDLEDYTDDGNDEMNKKMRTATNSYTDGSAVAAWQPRREP